MAGYFREIRTAKRNMADLKADGEVETRNQRAIDTLRETFTPMTQHLTPDVEPVTIYSLKPHKPEVNTFPENEK